MHSKLIANSMLCAIKMKLFLEISYINKKRYITFNLDKHNSLKCRFLFQFAGMVFQKIPSSKNNPFNLHLCFLELWYLKINIIRCIFFSLFSLTRDCRDFFSLFWNYIKSLLHLRTKWCKIVYRFEWEFW